MIPVFLNARDKIFIEIVGGNHITFGIIANHTRKFAVVLAVISVGILPFDLQFSAERPFFRGNMIIFKSIL